MMKLLITILISVFTSFMSYAQNPNWQWAKNSGGNGKDSGQKIAVDSQGSIYVLGGFRDNDMTIGTVTLINLGDDDIFLAKYDPNGSLIWAKNIGGTGGENVGKLILDKNDNVYITGTFSSPTLTIGTVTLINPNPNDFGNRDFFIAKYDMNGNVLWVKNSSNSNYNGGIVAIDNDFNTYVVTLTSTTATIEKYDIAENITWSKTLTSTGTISTVRIRSVYVDISGVYITGEFFGNTLTIGSTIFVNGTSQNSNDMYVIRLDLAGNLLWGKNTNNVSSDSGTDIKVDNWGNVYVLGQFVSNTLAFGSFPLVSNGNNDLFLVKYNPQGQVLWAKSAGGNQNDWVGSLALDLNGGAYVIGEFYSPDFTFGGTTVNNLGALYSYSDIYIVRYSSLGNESWIKSIQGLGNDNGFGIVVNNIGEVYVVGAIEDTLGGITNVGNFSLMGYGLDDCFLAKLSSTVSIVSETKANVLFIYPNPNSGQFTIELENIDKESLLEIYDVMGNKIWSEKGNNKNKINLTQHPKGIYLVKVISDNNIFTKKIIYQ